LINESCLVQTFLELVAIDSPTGHEKAISKDLARRLTELGGTVEADEHGNLIGRWPGQGEWLMLSAHMDTAGADIGIKPQIRDGVIYSDGATILGSDDKSGIAAILETIRSLQEDSTPHPPLEVVITVGEESALRGAKLLDASPSSARRRTPAASRKRGSTPSASPARRSLSCRWDALTKKPPPTSA
jgi:tripeptide aminopeptidase